jgi:hypothetical protein
MLFLYYFKNNTKSVKKSRKKILKKNENGQKKMSKIDSCAIESCKFFYTLYIFSTRF